MVAWEDTIFYQWKLDLEDAGMNISFVTTRPHVGKSRMVLWFLKIGKDNIDHPTTQLNKMKLSIITHCILNFNELSSVLSFIYFPICDMQLIEDQKATVLNESLSSNKMAHQCLLTPDAIQGSNKIIDHNLPTQLFQSHAQLLSPSGFFRVPVV